MHPRLNAQRFPDKAACIIAETGQVVTYAELEADANRSAHLFRSLGLQRGDVIALLLENNPFLFKAIWAAQRAGLYATLISPKLLIDEIDHILENSGSKLLISSPAVGQVALDAALRHPDLHYFMVDDAVGQFKHYQTAIASFPETPIAGESQGEIMLYSSGTTGRPKGIKPPLPAADKPLLDWPPMAMAFAGMFGMNEKSIYLSPAPLYHAAPLASCMLVQRFGGTVVVMQKFDPEFALQLIQDYRVTCSQWVPTHFVRMLKLPDEIRLKYDISSMKKVVHAAAPCPIAVKDAMIDWWGPIVDEYYSGTEGAGTTFISAAEWLAHKGSVGRAAPPIVIHICDDLGNPLPVGQEGSIYFSGGRDFTYHNDPTKTAAGKTAAGWTTLGDVGRVDKDGYLYLCDRKDFMIISGGVNIYPQEIENSMLLHPAIMDVAVFGAPDEEMGERVVAVVQPVDWASATPALADEILAFVRGALSHVKTPRSIDFMKELPRTATGKLMKRILRDEYRKKTKLQKA